MTVYKCFLLFSAMLRLCDQVPRGVCVDIELLEVGTADQADTTHRSVMPDQTDNTGWSVIAGMADRSESGAQAVAMETGVIILPDVDGRDDGRPHADQMRILTNFFFKLLRINQWNKFQLINDSVSSTK